MLTFLHPPTPTPGSPVPGEGHLPIPEAEGHHGLEEGELASPPPSLNPLCSLGQGAFLSLPENLKGWQRSSAHGSSQWVQSLRNQISWVQMLILPLNSCVTLDKLLHLSVLQCLF